MAKELITCQCEDPRCGYGTRCQRLATAEDFLCDHCRDDPAEDPVYGPFRAFNPSDFAEWIEPGPTIAWPYNSPPE